MIFATTVLVFIVCLISEAFFSGSEIALVAANAKKIRREEGTESRRAKRVLSMLKKPERFLATTLCGTNISVVTNSVFVTSLFLMLFEEKAELYTPLVLSPLLLIFGEIIPKSLFQQHATRIAPKVAPAIGMASYLLYPLVAFTSALARVVTFLLGQRKAAHTPFVTKDELRLIVKMSRSRSDVTTGEALMIDRIFDFTDAVVREGMIPLVEVSAIPDTSTVADAARVVIEKGHSRIPVYHDRIDNLVGVVTSFDLLGAGDPSQKIESLIRHVPFVPESKRLDELLLELQKGGNHMAIAVDEYGGAVGAITLEDILEEIVGEIRDEYDRGPELYRRIRRNKYQIKARMEIDQINELLPFKVPEGDYETLGGFLLERMGHVPATGETYEWDNLTLTITSSDDRSIGDVRVTVHHKEKKRRNETRES
jgi:CBS domain containing-hemolysin-like protein